VDPVTGVSLFERLLGDGFATLAPRVRALHALDGSASWSGTADIERGTHPLARLCAAIAGLPPAARAVPATVDFRADAQGETWRRHFGGARMTSRLRACNGRLCERLGPMAFEFALAARHGEIHWQAVGARLSGVLPLPARWFAEVRCREREYAGRYEFLVEARLPWLGPLIHYEGWLAPDGQPAA